MTVWTPEGCTNCGQGTGLDRRRFLAALGGFAAGTTMAGGGPPQPLSPAPLRIAVSDARGIPTLTIGGRPDLRPVFETYAPLDRHFRQFASAGTKVFSFSCCAAACDYGHAAPVWVAPDQRDFQQFDERVALVLEARPDALLVPRVNLGTPRWWLDEHPAELERFADGSTLPSHQAPTLPRDRAFPSLASPAWREMIAEALVELLDHAASMPWGRRIAGWFLAGLHTEEFYHWSAGTANPAGYGERTVAAFRRWLESRYGSVDHLRGSWGRAEVDFSNAEPPPVAARLPDPTHPFLRHPVRERQTIDFLDFWNELAADTIDYFAGIAKAHSPAALVGAFYGYLYEFAGDPEFGHNAASRLLESVHVDFMAVTASYFHREAGRGSDYPRGPFRSVQLHGKIWHHDNDTVSFLARDRLTAAGMTAGSPDWTRNLETQLRLLGHTPTAESTRWMYRRGLGFSLASGFSSSWFDLHGGYFDHPDLMAEIKRLGELAAAVSRRDRSSCAEILMLIDERAGNWIRPGTGFLEEILRRPQNIFTRIGAPVDHFLLHDLDRIPLERYRLVIVLAGWHVDAQREALIKDRLLTARPDGAGIRRVLWCGLPPVVAEERIDATVAERLLGMEFDFGTATTPRLVRPNLRLAEPAAGVGSALASALRAAGLDNLRPDLPDSTPCIPDVRIRTASGIDPVAIRSYDGALAFAERRDGDLVIGFLASPVIVPAAWREIARASGVHIYSERDDAFYACRSLACLHANGAGTRTLRFPSPEPLATWDDAGRAVPVAAADSWSGDLRDGETVLLLRGR